MSGQQISNQVFSIKAKGAGNALRAIGVGGTQVTAIGSRVIGFSEHDYTIDQVIKVNRGITVMAEAGAIIDATTTTLKTDSVGRVIPSGVLAIGEFICGVIKPGQIATAVGYPVEIIPMYP
jgi:hypothetical protein